MDTSQIRERILDAAVLEAQEKGLRGATTRAIAARAGVHEVTLFRYFGSKAALAKAAFEHHVARVDTAFLELPPPGATFEERLENAASAIVRILETQRPLLHLAIREARSSPVLRSFASGASGRFRDRLARWFIQEQQAGAMRAVDTDMAAQAFVGALFAAFVALWAVGAELPCERERFVRGVVDVFTHGVAARDEGAGGGGDGAVSD